MKVTLIITGVFIVLSINRAFCQVPVLKDTLIRYFYGIGYSGDSIVLYKDFESNKAFPLPKGIDGEMPGNYYADSFNSPEKIDQIAQSIFSNEEIGLMSRHGSFIKFVVSSKGHVVSASILFTKGDPGINSEKLISLSNKIKEKVTITIVFEQEVFEEGYISLHHRIFP